MNGMKFNHLTCTPRGTKLSEEHTQDLLDSGFAVDKETLGVPEVEEEDEDEISGTEGEVHEAQPIRRPVISNPVAQRMIQVIKKAEVQYGRFLQSTTQKPLDVTHTVSLAEVKNNIKARVPSAMREFLNQQKGPS